MAHRSTTKTDRVARAQRAAAAREARLRAQRRRRTAAVGVTVAAVVAAGIAVQAVRAQVDGPGGVPDRMVGTYGLPAGSASAPVTVEIFQDYLCPACRQFERASHATLRDMIDEGRVRVVYRPIAILDSYSTTAYSTRAANAVGCAADAGVALRMQRLLFRYQPPEGGPGLTDAQLISLGHEAGAQGSDFASCVRDRDYLRWTREATDEASKVRVVRTPTVRVDGVELQVPTVAALRRAVAEAAP